MKPVNQILKKVLSDTANKQSEKEKVEKLEALAASLRKQSSNHGE